MTFAREPLQVVEIVQPLCSRTFGTSPCLATGTKCFKTDATCRYKTALSLTDSIAMRFVAPASYTPAGGYDPNLAIPALASVSTAPTVLNVGSGNENLSPLGARSVAEVAIRDFPYNDVGYDPYLADRAYNPLNRGSFWTKWLARNPYHVGYKLFVYDGFVGDDLSEMIKREYSIEKIDAARSVVKITAKDILRKVTDTDVKAPALSPGSLAVAITSTATSFLVAGAVIADYPSVGRVRIGDEIIYYTSRAASGTNIRFSGLTRGNLNTEAQSHSQFDQVQRVLSYVGVNLHSIIYDLLVNWGKIPGSYIPSSDWLAEFTEWRSLYKMTAHISEPTSVQKLVGELCQQGMVNVWWDERVQKIRFEAQKPAYLPATLTQDAHLVADSVTITEDAAQRVSQVYVYYGLRSPVKSLTDKASYANAEVYIDVDKERQYGGESKVREIFCRWVPSAVIASSLASAYLGRFRDARKLMTFRLGHKDVADCWTGDLKLVEHFLDVDATGAAKIRPWLVTSAEVVRHGDLYELTAEDAEMGGYLWELVDDDETGSSLEVGCWVDAQGEDGAGNTPQFGWI